ncbi:hypothetical protein RHGRI_012441 [Rhododendron griersonianum]|uniref:SAC3 family protein B n=1 Tax=Rhododendron griersonianum TaxID=479676 RepID=A0AAV6KQH4_9ERIC|nr:hypothetical protein RHGRI_012441 [Rhododendron griersonianum]
MTFNGFGKSSGPAAPPVSTQNPFAYLPRPSPPTPIPFSSFPPQPSPRELEAPERTYPPPLAFQNNRSVMRPSYLSAAVHRSIEPPPNVGQGQKSFFNGYDAQTHQKPSAVASFLTSQSPAEISPLHDLKRTRSPQLLSTDGDGMRNSRRGDTRPSDLLFNDQRQSVPQRTQSPVVFPENHYSLQKFGPSIGIQRHCKWKVRTQFDRPASYSPGLDNRTGSPGYFSKSWTRQDQSAVLPYDSRKTFATNLVDSQVHESARSPPLQNETSQENPHFIEHDSKRPSVSPPRLNTKSNRISKAPNSEIPLPFARSIDDKAAATKPTNVPKRTRSPTLLSTDQVFQDNSSAQDDVERELQAKAKRLARFKVELSEPVESTSGIGSQKFSVNRHDNSLTGSQRSTGEHSSNVGGDVPNANVLSDFEGPESHTIISGLCPDMCPESERAERERKGDLDQYERLDGDRNQTSKSLAVKKYTRTAEREAELIRPMPILQQTIDYLLYLLDQPYDDKFLGLYNFLWDRMRAIRMDLRMQHIFNLNAITMLEQMIRLHIIAMHELCEYTKGEGFSEGFDAHLNIEQMNKTSVELFQLYDDHRKKGILVPTEKEFRGYYALLKLDKHPGYKVEPAELSLDLSKMTPEIRQTQEVLFARDVASCEPRHLLLYIVVYKITKEDDIENLLEYHGFSIREFEEPYMVKEGPFLNSDNDYPVKCSNLVHKKKSEAIVEDVSSPHVTVSLPGKEVKKVQLVKAYDQEPKPVHSVGAVSGAQATPVHFAGTVSGGQAIDEEMDNTEAVPSPKAATQVMPIVKPSLVIGQQRGDGGPMAAAIPFSWDFSSAHNSPKSLQPRVISVEKPKYSTVFQNTLERNTYSDAKAVSPIASERVDQEEFASSGFDSAMDNSVPQKLFIEDLEDEEGRDSHQDVEIQEVHHSYQDEEAAEAKLKLIFRLWKRRTMKRRELREQRQLASMAALNSLSLGPPIRQNVNQPSTSCKFNIDSIVNERHERQERSLSRLNVSDVIAGTLGARNPTAKCFCWKIILCSQMENPDSNNLQEGGQDGQFTAVPWLLSKLMPTKKDDDDDLVISSSSLSIWKKWVPSQSSGDLTCCLSVVKDAKFDNLNKTVLGANALLFLLSQTISLEIQKFQLHNLLRSLPSGSHLPLLIVTDSHEEDSDSSSIMAEQLGLHDIDKSQVSDFSIVFLANNQQLEGFNGFLSDEKLRGGLQWLASHSPLQPAINCVKTRELVLTQLSSSLEVLDEMGVYEVGPDQCISAYNEALNKAAGKVIAAAEENPTCWPCSEIAFLEKTSYESEVVNSYLPEIGWSSSEKIELLISALRETELPTFDENISWLYRGSKLGNDIEKHKVQLENCLIRYLTESSKMMGLSLATNEARAMIQKNARLELHNSTYYIVPNWVMIFQGVFNWRLMSLSGGAVSTAYVLERHNVDVSTSGADELGIIQGKISSPCFLIHPSLDEMVEAGCGALAEDEAFQPPLEMVVSNGSKAVEAACAINVMEAEMGTDNYMQHISNDSRNGLVVAAEKEDDEADRLSKLLEQCNILQDRIDKKLSIYF